MSSKVKKPAVKNERYETILRCKLQDKELIDRGNEMAEATSEAVNLEDQIASIKKEFQAKIDARTARIAELAGTIRAKSESRMVQCERTFNFEAGIVSERRLDTLEVLGSREMRVDERQQNLPMGQDE